MDIWALQSDIAKLTGQKVWVEFMKGHPEALKAGKCCFRFSGILQGRAIGSTELGILIDKAGFFGNTTYFLLYRELNALKAYDAAEVAKRETELAELDRQVVHPRLITKAEEEAREQRNRALRNLKAGESATFLSTRTVADSERKPFLGC